MALNTAVRCITVVGTGVATSVIRSEGCPYILDKS
jgi:hypothetical protein